MQREWRKIPGFDFYEASNDGYIRRIGVTRGKLGKELKPWKSGKTGYLQVGLSVNGCVSRQFVHRLVAAAFLGPPNGLCVDHINANRSDNRIENLRYATQQQNMAAARNMRRGYSRFRGVSYDTRRRKWCAWASVGRRTIGLGRFDSEIAAARAYNIWASQIYGDFADLNEVEKFGSAA